MRSRLRLYDAIRSDYSQSVMPIVRVHKEMIIREMFISAIIGKVLDDYNGK